MNLLYLMPLVPAAFAVAAWTIKKKYDRKNLYLIESVAGSCAIICLIFIGMFPVEGRALWFLFAAFVFSIFGDLVMKNRKKEHHLIFGIVAFFVAHLGFFGYSLSRVPFSWFLFGVVFLPFFIIYVMNFLPSVGMKGKKDLAIAAILYIIVSCFSFVATIDLEGMPLARWVYTAGITSFVVSDTFIAAREFLKAKKTGPWIMPLYYLCHVLVAFSVTLEYLGGA